jgi:Tfp pilus assembly protein PilV
MLFSRPSRQAGFTIIEVIMAATILVVGFIGMIEALAITSTQIDSARRQTLANQILNHHLEKLRLLPWDVTTTAPNELCINDLATASTAVAIDFPLWPVWSSITPYSVNQVVTHSGTSYRCIVAHANQTPPNATYWTATTTPATTDVIEAHGATFTLTRTVSDVVAGSLREVTFTVTMTVNTNRAISGTRQTFTYTRVNSAYYGKNGLNLTYQRS